MPIPLLDKLVSGFNGAYADANRVEIETENLSKVQGDNLQDVTVDLEGLFGTVSRIQTEITPSGRPFVVWNNSVTITAANINTFAGHNAIYSAVSDKRVNFLLPLQSDITVYPVIFEIQHFGGTSRFDQGATPSNTITIDTQPGDTSHIESPTDMVVPSVELHRGDMAIIVKTGIGQDWIVQEGSLDVRASILNDGIFTFSTRTINFVLNSGTGNYEIRGLDNYNIIRAEAFEVDGTGITEESTFGRAINAKDVMVSLVNNPNLVLTTSNEDWLIIHNAGSGELTTLEMRFLSQVRESDSNVNTRLLDDGATNAVIWLAPTVLSQAPTLTPSTDPNNPPTGQTRAYIGGTENVNGDGDFSYNGTNLYDGNMYIGVTPLYITAKSIANLYVQFLDLDGNVITEYSVLNDFEKPSFADTASIAYYIYRGTTHADTFREVRYLSSNTIRLIIRSKDRHFTLSNSINPTTSVRDLQESQLSEIVQGKLNKETSLNTNDRERLDSIEIAQETATIPANTNYKFKYNSLSHVFSDYQDINNEDGILGNFSAQPIAFLVDDSITVTNLTWSRGSIPVTEISPSIFDNYKTYTATIPAFAGSETQSPLNFPITLAGSKITTTATGLDTSLKIDSDNLNAVLAGRIFNALQELPTLLRRFLANATINNTTGADYEPTNDLFPKRGAFVYFKKQPVNGTSPVTNNDIINEIAASEVEIQTYPTLTNVYVPASDGTGGLSTVTDGYINNQRGIYNDSMVLTLPDSDNPLILFGFTYAFTRFITHETPILEIKMHGSDDWRTILSTDQDSLFYHEGNEDSTAGTPRIIRHYIYYVGGGIAFDYTASSRIALWRIYQALEYQLFITLFEDNLEFGTDSYQYTVTALNVRQEHQTNTITIQNSDGTQSRNFSITTYYTFHYSEFIDNVIEISIQGIAANQRIRLEVYNQTAATPSGSNLTFTNVAFDGWSAVRYVPQSIIMNLRTAGTGSNLGLAIYFPDGSSQVVDLKYPWADLDYSRIRIGASREFNRMVFYNFQGGKYITHTPNENLPSETELRDMLLHQNNLTEDYIYGLFHAPSNNVESVEFQENSLFRNLLLQSPDRALHRISIANDGSLVTTIL